jgi:hypothetical protein
MTTSYIHIYKIIRLKKEIPRQPISNEHANHFLDLPVIKTNSKRIFNKEIFNLVKLLKSINKVN